MGRAKQGQSKLGPLLVDLLLFPLFRTHTFLKDGVPLLKTVTRLLGRDGLGLVDIRQQFMQDIRDSVEFPDYFVFGDWLAGIQEEELLVGILAYSVVNVFVTGPHQSFYMS